MDNNGYWSSGLTKMGDLPFGRLTYIPMVFLCFPMGFPMGFPMIHGSMLDPWPLSEVWYGYHPPKYPLVI